MRPLSAAKIFLFLLTSSFSVYGQGAIKGLVRDSLTMDQLKGAEIILSGTTISAVSDIDAEFYITGIPTGEYMLQVAYFGYKGKKYLVNIKSEETLKLNVELLPDITNDNGTVFTDQARSQAEEINIKIESNIIKNVIAGKKLQDLPEENIPVALSRLPGVSIMYKPNLSLSLAYSGWSMGTDDLNKGLYMMFPPRNDFPITEDPFSRVLIRGLESKYSNVTIDGIRISSTSAKDKNIDLNIFSESEFTNIELHKTITSDEDADATAGAINIVTGKAPDKRMINAKLAGNYNRLDKSANQYSFLGNYGERFFDNLFGVQIDTKAERKIMSSENENNSLDMRLPGSMSYTNGLRESYGTNILLDYITPDGGSIMFKNIFNKTSADYFVCQVDTSLFRYIGDDHTFYDRKTEQKVFLSSIGGSNYLFGFNIDWNAAFSESIADHPYYFTLHSTTFFSTGSGSQEYLLYTIDSPSKNYSNEKTASINIYKKYNISNEITGGIKFGGKYRINSRSYDEDLHAENGNLKGNNQYIKSADGSLVKKDFSGTRFDGLVGKSINDIFLSYFMDNPPGKRSLFDKCTIPLINKDALRLWHQLNYSEYYSNLGEDINSYNLSESVFAGYVMHELNFGQSAKIITGLRIESEQNHYNAYYFAKATSLVNLYNGIPQQTETHHYNEIAVLPNFQMLLRPADFLNLRLAGYKTLIRPDYNARLPKYFSAGTYLNMGNPDLKNADVWNYEFQTQFYGNDIGQFSINAFFKDIKGMQKATNGITVSGKKTINSLGINWDSFPVDFPFGENQAYDLYTYYNSSNPTHIWGFEIEHQANFRYLPGLLKNIVLNYNLTFLRSETWTIGVEQKYTETTQYILINQKHKIDNIPEFFANVALGYDIKGFSFRISYFYQDGYPAFPEHTWGAKVMENKLSRLDIAVRQLILENISIILNINNITNLKEESTYYSGGKLRTFQAYRYGINCDLGIKVSL